MPNFNGKLNDNPLERSWILKILTKEYLLKKTKRDATYNFIFYRWWCILLKIRCGNFSLFLRERTQVFLEKQQITKNEITVFLFSLHGSCVKSIKNVPQKTCLFICCLIVQGKCSKNYLTVDSKFHFHFKIFQLLCHRSCYHHHALCQVHT